jgi:putative endonuclease
MFAWLRRWSPDRPRSLGDRGEAIAEKHLRQIGYRVVARHLRTRLGELDLVAEDAHTTVFVEVKTRASADHGLATDAITLDKQRRLTRAALGFLKKYRRLDRPARFDVIAVTWPEDGSPRIEHLKNAFEATGVEGMFS